MEEPGGQQGGSEPAMARRRLSSDRPRDALGRPLDWGVEPQIDLPPFDQLSIQENHRLAWAAFEAEDYFVAHEAWETAWKQSRAAGTDDVELFKGLAQIGAGYTHLARGNAKGAATLLRRGATRLAQNESQASAWGFDAGGLVARCQADASAIEKDLDGT